MIIVRESIISYYEYFYSQKYLNKDYKFKPSEKADKTICSFLSTLDKEYKIITLGKNFLSRYFSFQFSRLENQVFKRFSSSDKAGRINIYDIIGNKAFTYWKDRNSDFDYNFNNIIDLDRSPNDCIEINISEELEKARFNGSEATLPNCLEKTTLFNHKSSICISCKFQNDCKKLLEKNYPNIYKNRGYEPTT